jgi:hypothetical protein
MSDIFNQDGAEKTSFKPRQSWMTCPAGIQSLQAIQQHCRNKGAYPLDMWPVGLNMVITGYYCKSKGKDTVSRLPS